ncbi:MAG: S9 family peptidase [Terriglobales bacterium]
MFSTNLSGRMNLWKVRSSGGWPIQLTQSDDRQENAAWSPDGQWIVYQQDHAGDEMWDLYAVSSTGGNAENLTHTPEAREETPSWSPDGSQIALLYKPRTASSYDIELLDWKTRKVRLLTHEATPDQSWRIIDWSPDGKTLYATRVNATETDADIFAIDAVTGQARGLTPHRGKALFLGSRLSPDGRTLLVNSNQKGGYLNVALLEIASGKLHWVTNTEWQASGAGFSRDGRSVAYTINADGQVDAYLADLGSGRSEPVSFPAGINSFAGNPGVFAPRADQVLISHESATRPPDLWVYDLNTKSSRQVTFSAIASLASAPMPSTQLVHYRSYDGQTISALLWMPFNLKRGGSNPLLVLPHGGPTAQSVDRWSTWIAAYVSRGYICIEPNVRGSTGYGVKFQRANYQDLGGGDLLDEIYAVKFLESTGFVDPKRIGITGASYGGYMTVMALAKTPDIWAAGVEFYGIIDWKTIFEHTDAQLKEYEKGLLGDPAKDPAVYENSSPLKYLNAIKAPLLVLQGEKDPRVPKEEAEQVVATLTEDGKSVDVHYYPDEGHGFAKREDQIDAINRSLAWFAKYLRAP